MAYTALYRKWRPQTFEDVKGQDHIVTTLKNQIRTGRIGHAYLFCGTRGTGKTTIAKIFARAVNCERPVDGNPCGACAACRSIAGGNSVNVVEIDAASNNGVDNIREIRSEVQYSPAEGKYRVYIIDEVHMLSTGAFNALLKTLEEPPSYVIFILATTEAHKIPVTVLSRCQRYDFRRIGGETIIDRLAEMAAAERIDVEEKALRYIAKKGDGSMRDAISLFDQCIAFHYGERLTCEKVLEVLGAVDNEVFSGLLRNVAGGDTVGSLRIVEEIVLQGREITQFVLDFTWYMRNLLLFEATGDAEGLDVTAEDVGRLEEEAKLVDGGTLMRYIRIFSDLTNQLKYASQKRVLLEIALIKLCRPEMEPAEDTMLERIRAVEKKLEEGLTVAGGAGERIVYRDREAEEKPAKKPELPQALNEEVKAVAADFRGIANDASPMLRTYLKKARLSAGDGSRLMIVLPDEVSAGVVGSDAHKEEIKELIAGKTGRKVEIDVCHVEEGRRFEDSFADIEAYIKEAVHMDLTVEDD